MPAGIRVSVDLKEFAGRFSPAAVVYELTQSMRSIVLDLSRSLAEASPQHWQTDSKTWRPAVAAGGQKVLGSVTAATARVKYAILGFKAHIIRPRFKKALAWRKGGKGPVSAYNAGPALATSNYQFARHVHHPGFKGYHFPERVVPEVLNRQANALADRIARMLAR